MKQMARNLTDPVDGFLVAKQYVIMDRDPLFNDAFRTMLASAGTQSVRLPARSPNLNPGNPHAEFTITPTVSRGASSSPEHFWVTPRYADDALQRALYKGRVSQAQFARRGSGEVAHFANQMRLVGVSEASCKHGKTRGSTRNGLPQMIEPYEAGKQLGAHADVRVEESQRVLVTVAKFAHELADIEAAARLFNTLRGPADGFVLGLGRCELFGNHAFH